MQVNCLGRSSGNLHIFLSWLGGGLGVHVVFLVESLTSLKDNHRASLGKISENILVSTNT